MLQCGYWRHNFLFYMEIVVLSDSESSSVVEINCPQPEGGKGRGRIVNTKKNNTRYEPRQSNCREEDMPMQEVTTQSLKPKKRGESSTIYTVMNTISSYFP